MELNTIPYELSFSRTTEDTLHVRIAGSWKIDHEIPSASDVQKEIASGPRVQRITFDTGDLTAWDSGLLNFLTKIIDQCSLNNIQVDMGGLSKGVRRLIELATAVPERAGARREAVHVPFLERMGDSAIAFWRSTIDMVGFVGEAFIAFTRMLRGKAQFHRSDLFLFMQEAGAQALPIVSLISLLVGLILAFVGAIQLMMFGAQIYVASLVGISMVRVMGAIMTGIIMAGRTGASYAAQLGTMQVNEEIDALSTLGVSPMEFLVLPRMLALTIMMPLLCLYADLMGILGGLIVGVSLLDLNVTEYMNKTQETVKLVNLWIGLFHSFVFGMLIALAGCMRGMQCGRSASAVGEATTSAVVTSIVSIILATAIITVACNVIGI